MATKRLLAALALRTPATAPMKLRHHLHRVDTQCPEKTAYFLSAVINQFTFPPDSVYISQTGSPHHFAMN